MEGPIRCFYRCVNLPNPKIIAGFAVGRETRRAVNRNYLKHLLRESFRLNKYLLDKFIQKGKSLLLVFVYTAQEGGSTKETRLQTVEKAMLGIFSQLEKTVQ